MLGTRKLVFQDRHLLLRAVEHAAQFIGETKIDRAAVHLWTPFELARQSLSQAIHRHANFFEQWPGYAVALVKKRGKKMLIRNFLMIKLRCDILRRLQRLLHFLREFVDAHISP